MDEKKNLFENVSPRFTFLFGITIGIAAFSLFGYISLLSRVSVDSAEADTKNTQEETGTVAGDTAEAEDVVTADTGTDIAVVTPSDTDHMQGSASAQLTIVEYSDLECPYCSTFHNTMKQVMDEYDGQVNWVFRHLPLSFHSSAQKLAEGAECATELGGEEMFWKYIDKVFAEGTTEDGIVSAASNLGLNASSFSSCLDSDKYADTIDASLTEAMSAGVTGTPTSVILDASGDPVQTIPGALPFSQVTQLIDQALGK